MEALLKDVADLIHMEAVMYVLLLTMPMDKEWVKMKAVRKPLLAPLLPRSPPLLTLSPFWPLWLVSTEPGQAFCRDYALLRSARRH
jgi:hypothetical protein